MEEDKRVMEDVKFTNRLRIAELLDAYRVVPRILLCLYVVLVGWVVGWYMDFTVIEVRQCDSNSLSVLLTNNVPYERAWEMSCPVSDVVGHPNGFTLLVTTVVGAAAVVFGLYTGSGRKW